MNMDKTFLIFAAVCIYLFGCGFLGGVSFSEKNCAN
jgi:hypothetical protein